MPTADNDGVELWYEVVGPADAETIVFVEGLGYATWMWTWQREALAEDYQLVLWDNRGVGESDVPPGPYTIPEMAGDLAAVLDDAGLDSVHLVGASMGGMIAQEYLLGYNRATSATLLCTTHGGDGAEPIPQETLDRILDVPDDLDERAAVTYKMEPATTERFRETHPEIVEQIVDWRVADPVSDQARGWQAAAVEAFDTSDRLDVLATPVLVLHGDSDRVVPVANGELLAAAIPDAAFHVVEGGPHLFFIERADTVNQHIRSFVDRHA
jgi:3-oxoadipate enol-lactonase